MILLPLIFAASLGDLSNYPDMAKYADLPRDVRVFIDRRMGCNHFAGEEPYNEERARQLEAAARELRCRRLESDETRLRRRYVRMPRVLKALTDTRDDYW
jgi:hypothetical protein